MMFSDTALLARRASASLRWSRGGLLLALAVGCGQGGRARASDALPQSHTPAESSEPVGSTPSESEPVVDEGSNTASQELDAGPIQFQFAFDASTTPTSEYVRGVDAAAGEAERGFTDEDAGSDAGP